jgi:hypothetical protein
MSGLAETTYRVLALDLEIREYPVLRDVIRKRMRAEMFRRGVLCEDHFEDEVRTKAQASQRREGLTRPCQLELAEVWELRCSRVRDTLTDFYFGNNLPHSVFHTIVADVLGERNQANLVLNFNPETAPWDLLFAQASEFEAGNEEARKRTEHHLQEIIAVLTKGMLSDQLAFVGLARKHFQIGDLREIGTRRIGRGKVGGKAAGLTLARRILQTRARTIRSRSRRGYARPNPGISPRTCTTSSWSRTTCSAGGTRRSRTSIRSVRTTTGCAGPTRRRVCPKAS